MNMNTSGAGKRDYIGYALGDFGMQASFGLISSVLQKYYTDVLCIPIASVMLLFIFARIWDAANDPMWGSFVDSRAEGPGGRYRRFILWFSIPMALSTVLMFVKIPGLETDTAFVLASVTYVLFGMVYTCVNVPYGSLASVITPDDGERTKLSTFRSVGSALGTVPAMLLIVLCYKKTESGSVMDYSRILAGVIIISVIAAASCLLCGKLVRERVAKPPKQAYGFRGLTKLVIKIVRQRPFWSLSLAAMLYLAASVFSQSYYTYLADKYFGMNSLSMIAMVCQYVPVAVIMLFMGKAVKKFGRKEICAAGTLIAAFFNFILWIIQTDNPYIFLLFCLLAGVGNAFMFLQVWALATELADYNRLCLGIGDDAVVYSLFSFVRKMGHAVAAVFVNASLLEIGYSTANLSDETLSQMYNSSVLIPAILYTAVFLLLCFAYPLSKKKLGEIREKVHQDAA